MSDKKPKRKPAGEKPSTLDVDVEMLRRLGQQQGGGSVTNIECVMEGAMMVRGVNYKTQVELGFTRIDHMIFNGDGTATAVYEDGDYWHADQHGHDYGKVQQLIGFEVDGHTITQAVRVMESDLLKQTDWVVDNAVVGEQVRTLS